MTTRVRDLKTSLALVLLSAAMGWMTACHTPPSTNSPLQYAYIGPSTATLREDLAVHSSQVTSVKHGDRVEILDTRRRLVRVRAPQGGEGWIDANLLLTGQQMDELNRITELAAKLPAQGMATVGDALNAHTGPSRQAPTLFQIPENGSVEVLAHRSSPRVGPVSEVVAAIHARPARQEKLKRKGKPAENKPAESNQAETPEADEPEIPPLPLPPPPAPPINWQSLSVPRSEDLAKGNAGQTSPPPPPDDWSLVRTPDHQVGWALSRNLSMSIPDEVIRYTDGHRVTAYLDLGEVPDENRGKHSWVWTTVASRGAPYDFDSFHVLIWNPVKHRYETARIEKNLAGFYPLAFVPVPAPTVQTIKQATPPAPPTAGTAPETAPKKRGRKRRQTETAREDVPSKDEKRFSLVVSDGDRIYQRVYALAGRRVRLVSTALVPPPAQSTAFAHSAYDPLAAPPVKKGWWDRAEDWVKGLARR